MLDQGIPVATVRGWCSPQANGTTPLLAPGPAIRLRARLGRLELDRALAAGADPSASPLLAARAAQLVRRRTRQRLADGLEHIALTVDARRGRFRTPPLRGAVRANRAELMELAATLRRARLVYARGMALLELILIDGTGPAYTDPAGEGLARRLALVADALTR